MKAYHYLSRLINITQSNVEFGSFKYCPIDQIYDMLKTISVKEMLKNIMVTDERRLEFVHIMKFLNSYIKFDLKDIIDDYMNFVHSEIAKPEKKNFLERLNKSKKYREVNLKLISFAEVLPEQHTCQTASICLNFLKYNEVEPWREAVMLSLAYYLVWNEQSPKYLNRILRMALKLIDKVLNEQIS